MKRKTNTPITPDAMIPPVSRGRTLYEWLCIILLLSGSILGPILFGAVRLWSFGGLSVITLLGCLLTFILVMRTEKRQWLVLPPASIPILLFLAYCLIRIPFSPITYEARIEFLKIAALFTAYWAWMHLLDKPGRWRILVSILILTGAGISLYALIQNTQESIMVLNRVGEYGRRVSGTYVCPNHFAAYAEIILCLALAMILMKSSGWALKIFSFYAVLTIVPAIYFTQSRSGWIGAFVGISAVLLLWCWRKSTKWFLAMLVAIPVVIVATSITVYNSSELVQKRIDGFLKPAPPESGAPFRVENCRLYFWKDTIEMIEEKPVFGYGGGSYRYAFPHFITRVFPGYVRYAHNDYLHHIAEYGIVGLLLFAAIIIVGAVRYLIWIKRTDRDKNACLAIALLGALAANLAHCFFDYNMQYFSNNSVLLLIAALAAAAFFSSGEFKLREMAKPYLVWVPVCALIIAMLTIWGLTLTSYGYVLIGNQDQEELEWLKAEKDFSTALKYDPGNWNALVGLGQIYKSRATWEMDAEMKKELLEKSLDHYQTALQGNPYEASPKYGVSQILFMQGKTDQALEMQEEITQYYPGYIFYKIRYALNLRKAGRYEEALEMFNAARRLSPSDSERKTIDANRRYLREKIKESKGK